jgi:hypothetical protein
MKRILLIAAAIVALGCGGLWTSAAQADHWHRNYGANPGCYNYNYRPYYGPGVGCGYSGYRSYNYFYGNPGCYGPNVGYPYGYGGTSFYFGRPGFGIYFNR